MADFQDPMAGNASRCSAAFPYLDPIAESQFFRHADAIIANTDTVAALWKRRYPRWEHKIRLIWNGFDPETEVRASELPTRPYRVLAHVGAIAAYRPPTLLLASLDRLVARGLVEPGTVRVRLVGHRAEYPEDPEVVASLNSKGMLEQLPPVSVSEARQEVAEADYLLLLDVITRHGGLQVPSKILDYVRVGRPILAITTRNSPVERILSRSGVPHACLYPDLDPAEIDRRVIAFFDLPTSPVDAGAWFRHAFNAEHHTEQLASIFDEVQHLDRRRLA